MQGAILNAVKCQNHRNEYTHPRTHTHTHTDTVVIPLLQCFSDPTHTLRNNLKERGLIEVKISGGENSTDSGFYKVHPKIKTYKHGVVQPGVLCVDAEGKKLYAWAIDPAFVSWVQPLVVVVPCGG